MAERRAAQIISIKEASARVKAERAARLKAQKRFAAAASADNHRPLDPRWLALLNVLVVMLFVLGGVFLVRELRSVSVLQDCVMSGRTNCAPIDVKPLRTARTN